MADPHEDALLKMREGLASRTHSIACGLTIVATLALLFSPPVVNAAEFPLFAIMLFSAAMRQRLVQVWRQPMTKGVLAFYAVTCIGTLYSVAPLYETAHIWAGWSKLLLLPIAMALFDDPRWKQRFLLFFIGVVTLCALISFGMWVADYATFIEPGVPGILVRNHSTQGLLFAVGAYAACLIALNQEGKSFRLAMAACALLMMANIVFVTTGRSGYVAALMLTAIVAASILFRGGRRPSAKTVMGTGLAVLVVLAGFALTPTTREHILLGVHNVQDYKQEKQYTSMGIRMIFWKNALTLIEKRPLFGYGTGGFGTAYAKLVQGRPGLEGLKTGDPHDQYMKVLAEHGIFGLAVFLAMLFTAWRQRPSAPYRLLGLGVLAVWCTTSLANSHFSTFAEGSFIFLWLGMMLGEEDRSGARAQAAVSR
jgi:O-antigen ligase